MEILISILIIIILLMSYIIFNMRRKLSKYEQLVDKYDTMIISITEYLKLSLDNLYRLDANQIFEGDDEVGWFFKSLKELYIQLNNNIARLINDENSEKENSEEFKIK